MCVCVACVLYVERATTHSLKTTKRLKISNLFCFFLTCCLALVLFFPSRCQCPAQFEGPECQQNKHSFYGNGYAWFPPMMPCFESHVSLEFITDVVDGLLLYSGPLAQLQAWDHEDFMAIGRRLYYCVSSGSDSMFFTVWGQLWLRSDRGYYIYFAIINLTFSHLQVNVLRKEN